MLASFRKTKKTKKYSAQELVDVANKLLGEGWLYIKAPYAMSTDEFLIHYGKYFFYLPTAISKDDLINGIYSPTGAKLVSFYK